MSAILVHPFSGVNSGLLVIVFPQCIIMSFDFIKLYPKISAVFEWSSSTMNLAVYNLLPSEKSKYTSQVACKGSPLGPQQRNFVGCILSLYTICSICHNAPVSSFVSFLLFFGLCIICTDWEGSPRLTMCRHPKIFKQEISITLLILQIWWLLFYLLAPKSVCAFPQLILTSDILEVLLWQQ